ncbi:hypothetical protein DFP73DRAFT_191776 [Morchella snyderi]|nr:hypothetical protein DFP73DRAFT_191776 [Morchella snyderi]
MIDPTTNLVMTTVSNCQVNKRCIRLHWPQWLASVLVHVAFHTILPTCIPLYFTASRITPVLALVCDSSDIIHHITPAAAHAFTQTEMFVDGIGNSLSSYFVDMATHFFPFAWSRLKRDIKAYLPAIVGLGKKGTACDYRFCQRGGYWALFRRVICLLGVHGKLYIQCQLHYMYGAVIVGIAIASTVS